jgi:hypothetical protein
VALLLHPHSEFKRCNHWRRIGLGDLDRVTDVVLMAVRQSDVCTAHISSRHWCGWIATKKWINYNAAVAAIENESTVSKPSNFKCDNSALLS